MFPRLLFTLPLSATKRGILSTLPGFSFTTRCFSTTAGAGVDAKDALPLLEREHFIRVRTQLEKDARKKITLNEYHKICEQEGLGKEQASRLCKSLSDSGVILHFPQSSNHLLQNVVFLKPQEINALLSRVVDQLSPESTKHLLATTKVDIEALKAELKPFQEQRTLLERKAHRHANTIIFFGLGYCVLQFLAIGRLTWWELSWDVMEPVTYMLTFGTALIGYTFFVATGSEYTYEGLKKTLQHRKLDKLIKKTHFDEVKFSQLSQELQKKEFNYKKLSAEPPQLIDLSQYGSKEVVE